MFTNETAKATGSTAQKGQEDASNRKMAGSRMKAEAAEAEKYAAQQESLRKAALHQAFEVQAQFTAVNFQQLADLIYSQMFHQGFWDGQQSNMGSKIALMHSELGEATEADRKGITSSEHIPDFTGLEEEFADTIVRILDVAGRHKMRLGEAIIAKMHFNIERSKMHGKAY